MAIESTAPAPSSGGFSYAIVGLLLAAGAVAMFFLFDCGAKDRPGPAIDAGVPIARSTALDSEDFEVPQLAVMDAGYDAGLPEAVPEPRRVVRAVRCDGNLDPRAVQSVVAQNRRQVRSCYERALRTNQLLQGRINVQLTVAPSGAVSNVGVAGSLNDATVTSCVRGLAQQWAFPPPSGGCVVVNVPFMMTPREP